MDYELAKKLKEAGFSQTRIGSGPFWLHILARSIYDKAKDQWWMRHDHWKIVYSRGGAASFPKNEWLMCPTLDELIAGCGEKFTSLDQMNLFLKPTEVGVHF